MADAEKRMAALEKQSQATEKLANALKEARNGEHDMVKSLLGRVAELEKQTKTQTR